MNFIPKHGFFSKISVFLLLIVSACAPATAPAMPVENEIPPTEVLITPNVESTELPTLTPTPEPQAEQASPYVEQLATRLENVSQTINGVTVTIDWAYVDESRVSLQYTVSGLDWPDGAMLDAMQQVQIRIPVLSDARFGGFSGASRGSSSQAEQGVITAYTDQFLGDGILDAEKYSSVKLKVDIPVEGATKVGTFHFDFNVPVANGFRIENVDRTVDANNVSMTLKTLVINPFYVDALICFQMPSAVDWGLTASKLMIGGKEYPFSGGGVLQGTSGKDFALTDPERCSTIGFDTQYDESASSITLTVPKLVGSVPEVIDEERLAMANQRLADKGIQFNYVMVDHGGKFEILKRPENMPDEELYPLIWDALAEQYEGPWVFTVPIK